MTTPSEAADKASTDLQAIADRVGKMMWAEDHASQHLGMELLAVQPGQATIRMKVTATMVNGHGLCHGGYIFMLADSTFAFACNSHGQRAVAASASIEFLAPAREGDSLTCHGQMRQQGKRNGLYDMTVTNQEGQTIALFRGRSATIKGSFLE